MPSLVTISLTVWAASGLPFSGLVKMAGVKMYFDTRAPHIAPKSLKRSLAPGLLNSSTLGVIGVEIPGTFSGRCCRCLDPDYSTNRAAFTACTHG